MMVIDLQRRGGKEWGGGACPNPTERGRGLQGGGTQNGVLIQDPVYKIDGPPGVERICAEGDVKAVH